MQAAETRVMPRQARLVIPNVPHHIYLRGNNRRRLFSTNADRTRFIGCLARGLETSASRLHQLTLMENHVHMIAVPPGPDALRVLIHRTCLRYAQVRNHARDATGKLFEERFHSKPILDDAYLATATIYNDVNAYRAGVVTDPLGHLWSTGPLHAGRTSMVPRDLWTPSAWYLALGATTAERATRYCETVAAHVRASSTEPGSARAPRYRLRVERPDGTSARDGEPLWLPKAE